MGKKHDWEIIDRPDHLDAVGETVMNIATLGIRFLAKNRSFRVRDRISGETRTYEVDTLEALRDKLREDDYLNS